MRRGQSRLTLRTTSIVWSQSTWSRAEGHRGMVAHRRRRGHARIVVTHLTRNVTVRIVRSSSDGRHMGRRRRIIAKRTNFTRVSVHALRIARRGWTHLRTWRAWMVWVARIRLIASGWRIVSRGVRKRSRSRWRVHRRRRVHGRLRSIAGGPILRTRLLVGLSRRRRERVSSKSVSAAATREALSVVGRLGGRSSSCWKSVVPPIAYQRPCW